MAGSVSKAALPAVCLAYFMVILDTTIVNVALPTVARDLQVNLEGLQWVVDGYLLVLAAVLLGGGALADRLGARCVFQIGVAVFVAASRPSRLPGTLRGNEMPFFLLHAELHRGGDEVRGLG